MATSIPRYHAEWLLLVDISGPFLTIAALTRVFPQGIDGIDTALAGSVSAAYAEWDAGKDDRGLHRAWLRFVVRDLLGWTDATVAEGQAIPAHIAYSAREQGGETIRPDMVLHTPGDPATPALLIGWYPPGTGLEKPISGALWTASPVARMTALLRAAGVRVGIVSNGETWMLVNAPADGLSGTAAWTAELWTEERLTLRAFAALLGVQRFLGVADGDTLPALLAESADDVGEVTDQLGAQVRRAVGILVRAIDRCDRDLDGRLLTDIDETTLYQAALTVMMRLVFLLSAEERGLFLLGDPLYDQHYAVSTLRAQLHESADRLGEDAIERRGDAWARLLAVFRLVYGGAAHEALRLPAYGGGLFDPARYPFLEGNAPGLNGTPPAIDNRTVLHLLDALQTLQTGGEARRVSFRGLDIEQIGHVYEGLLDHRAARADGVLLALTGSGEPIIALADLLSVREADRAAWLKTATGRSGVGPIRRALDAPPDGERARRLERACAGDRATYGAVLPYLNLMRDDEFGAPYLILTGEAYVTSGTARRDSGTHYTPRALTEPVVEHTLAPLVYVGLREGLPPEAWTLAAPDAILRLKVCDMAMGSGAFLVAACRYLAARLNEAWTIVLARAGSGKPNLTVEGAAPTGAISDILIPEDPDERAALALRLIADRCLYGVDKNPLAVEMGKLSLWLITLAKGRPFTFLDHALKCGDSLLGASLRQVRAWNVQATDGAPDSDADLFNLRLQIAIDSIRSKRAELESFTVISVDDQRRKARLLAEAESTAHEVRTAADYLILSGLVDGLSASGLRALRGRLLNVLMGMDSVTDADRALLGAVFDRYTPFHWHIEFPEVFARADGGFDAIIGNPPFQGGKLITGSLGIPYRDYLVEVIARGARGNADLCAYFFLRAHDLLRSGGGFGLIATNTIAQGDTRAVGLVQLVEAGMVITRAEVDTAWPGAAAVVVDVVHAFKGVWNAPRLLDGAAVGVITPLLDDIAVEGRYLPERLIDNADRGFIGSLVHGIGFVMTEKEARALIEKNPHNRDVLFPYLNGEDLNEQPDQAPTRWVINFFDWSEERAQTYPDAYAIVREKVKPERDRLANGDSSARAYARYWWRYGRMGLNLYRTIAPLSRVLVTSLVSKYVSFAFVPASIVYAHRLAVFPLNNGGYFAVLQSVAHDIWARKFSSTLETRLNYAPSDAFETFPFPDERALATLDGIGEQYHEARRAVMLVRGEGLTATYNRFHDPAETDADIAHLRDLHRRMDEAVAAAYGWDDLALEHGFHTTQDETRYTISDVARREVLRRLLALNFARKDAETSFYGSGGERAIAARARDATVADPDHDPDLPPEQTELFDDGSPKQQRLL